MPTWLDVMEGVKEEWKDEIDNVKDTKDGSTMKILWRGHKVERHLFWVPEKNKKFPAPDFLHYLSHFVYKIVCIHA